MQATFTEELAGVAVPASIHQLGDDVYCYERVPGQAPLFICCREGGPLAERQAFLDWVRASRPVLDRLIVAHGGIVLRGFALEETADFGALTALFPQFAGSYEGGRAPRKAIQGQVMESTRLASSVRLAIHSEMAYMRDYPRRIAFFSRQTAIEGGETIIGDMRGFVVAMPAAIRGRLEQLGTRMTRNFGPPSQALDDSYADMDQRGWNQAFFTDERADVERICAGKGLRPLWHDDGSLTVFNDLEPFVTHPATGQKLYRSVIHMRPQVEDEARSQAYRRHQKYRTGASLGNGERLSEDEVAQMEALCDRFTHQWPWRDGDVMILDNLQVWHGRNPYRGPREVQVALLD